MNDFKDTPFDCPVCRSMESEDHGQDWRHCTHCHTEWLALDPIPPENGDILVVATPTDVYSVHYERHSDGRVFRCTGRFPGEMSRQELKPGVKIDMRDLLKVYALTYLFDRP